MRTHPPVRYLRVAAAAAVALLGLVACDSGGAKSSGSGDQANGAIAAASPSDSGPQVAMEFTGLTDGATDVPTSLELAYKADAPTSTLELVETNGGPVQGAWRSDKSAWVPGAQLKYGTQYTAKITATTADGRTATKAATFTTMAKPGSTAKASTVIGDNQVVGVAMPIIVSFSADIPKDQRASVQKRLFVTSEPAQEGIWYWWNNREVHFRTKEYWQSGTKVQVRAAVGGLPLGGNRYGAQDLTMNFKIGAKTIMEADNTSKHLTITKNGQVLRRMPVSFGKPATPTDAGNMMVMIKNKKEVFDSSTFGRPVDGPGGYRKDVFWTQRLSWSGEYLHAAPWSEGDQGKRNVSNGCTNLSNADAEWLYNQTQVGDPVIIKGTEEHVKWQDGYTHWDRSFADYAKGSAIPLGQPDASPALLRS
ncbi:hypothetical protein Val02_66140 [Virgisporangium aliadipatigenens]|uniref:L,D-TPase catalytic domain-containing protein n=1 Tax=Virgisporangium aliadipatigenens TaxID=741659 RepID=A0A8J3YSQ3_9ACTN|nr:Ig-like domain-containing protein [Virgisporangium aliadipatigenens]GIJ49728.1 hypothetical protein Val02_66140 [Virgisporangium aliadipatigenens]